jgi:predicted ArsR family transcriptional regulator
MKTAKLNKRFFDSTRGQIVGLLRGTTGTVSELATKLGLTDNAVRAHLLTLERDGLIRQSGLQKGSRKPHFAYELTPEAELLFPKAYDTLLNQLIAVLKARLSPKAFRDALRAVGRSLALQHRNAITRTEDLESRAQRVLKALEELGGLARIEKEDDKLVIRSNSCPLATVVAEHPETCKIVESQISEIVGAKVRERCSREESPRCCFEITETAR